MNYQQLQYQVSDKVATITFNRPDRLNAWTPVLKGELREAVMAADADGAVNCIVLTGAGRAFCAGMDMEVLSAMGSLPAGAPDPSQRYTYLLAVSKPLIAAINGAVAGVGLCVALHCDMRFMASGAKLSAPYARRGLAAEHGSAWLLPRLIGHMHAADLLFSGRTVLAEEAAAMGLVSLMPSEGFREAVHQRASDIAKLASPRSVSIMKRQMLLAQQQSIEEATEMADAEIAACRETKDFKEGVAHFMEKRAPHFTGH